MLRLGIVACAGGILVLGTIIGVRHHQNLRDRDAQVRKNFHVIALSIEDFAVQTYGKYATDSTDTTPTGLTIRGLCPDGKYPLNPYTGKQTVIRWNEDPANPGEIGINPADSASYTLKAHYKTHVSWPDTTLSLGF